MKFQVKKMIYYLQKFNCVSIWNSGVPLQYITRVNTELKS